LHAGPAVPEARDCRTGAPAVSTLTRKIAAATVCYMAKGAPQDARKLVHIRVSSELHSALRSAAAKAGGTLQETAVRALRAGLHPPPVQGARGLTAVYSSRFSDDLHQALATALAATPEPSLYGIYLLDFLAEDGWGHFALSHCMRNSAQTVRILVQDPESPCAHWRQILAADDPHSGGIPPSADEKRRKAREVRTRVQELRAQGCAISARKYPHYPIARWFVVSEQRLFLEPHCPRLQISPLRQEAAGLPVYEFQTADPAAGRYLGYYEAVWRAGSPL